MLGQTMRFNRPWLAALLLGAAVACSSDPIAPFQPEVGNIPDNFQLQATDVTGVTATQTYSWSNSGTRATINHSTVTTDGTTRLILRDASGVVVYDKALSPSLNEPTAVGMAGNWTIELQLKNYTGTLNLRSQKL